MSNENMTWQDVCRELLRLDAQGVEEPWREFEAWLGMPFNGWRESKSLYDLIYCSCANLPLRLKPRKRTVYVNLYPDGKYSSRETSEDARELAMEEAIAVAIPVEIEEE